MLDSHIAEIEIISIGGPFEASLKRCRPRSIPWSLHLWLDKNLGTS